MRIKYAAAASVVVLVTAGGFGLSSTAAADTPGQARAEIRESLVDNTDPDLVAAMRDEFGYSTEQVFDRLTTETLASANEQSLRGTLGDGFGGLWIGDGATTVHVAITDKALADEVEAYGYVPELVDRGEAELSALQGRLDASASAPDGVTVWYGDVRTNTVTVLALPAATDAARAWALGAGVPADALTVEADSAVPQTYANIVGGNAYYINNSARCSSGFSVTHPSRGPGFVSAGHCGRVGATVTSGVGATGSFIGSSFPTNDYSYIDAGSSWTASPYVNRYSGSVRITGRSVAPVGSSICRSGSTTGWHCGTVQQLNTSVTYAQGTVYQVTRTSVCAEPGDSGGAYVAGSNAQGMTSGGSGNCRSGGTTFFQPVNEVLSTYGLTLTV